MGEVSLDRWARISADGTFDGVSIFSPDQPTQADLQQGETAVLMPIGWDPDPAVSLFLWAGNNQAGATGWLEINMPKVPVPITAMQFKLLFTQSERMAIHTAAATDLTLYDYLDLIGTNGAGIDLDHPVVVAGIQHLVDATIITSDRAAQILAGTVPG